MEALSVCERVCVRSVATISILHAFTKQKTQNPSSNMIPNRLLMQHWNRFVKSVLQPAALRNVGMQGIYLSGKVLSIQIYFSSRSIYTRTYQLKYLTKTLNILVYK